MQCRSRGTAHVSNVFQMDTVPYRIRGTDGPWDWASSGEGVEARSRGTAGRGGVLHHRAITRLDAIYRRIRR
ncbi:MAG: hypothetical protein WC728_01970 [Elusimicrobiota bacterium]